MTPLAASLALAVGLSSVPAARPGAGVPVSGVYGTAAGAAAAAGSKLAPGGKRPARPRADSFVPGMPAAEGPTLRRVLPPFAGAGQVAFPDTLEAVFFSNTRPVRVRVVVRLNGAPLSAAWDAHLRKLFAAFDRDSDGGLNRFECDHIFSARGMAGLLLGAHYYRTPTAPPTLDELDRDADGRVSYPEFAAYYAGAAADLVRPRSVPVNAGNLDQLTHELFAKLDQDRDGKLNRAEVAKAESILVTSDRDDDECLSPAEIFPDLYDAPRRLAPASPRGMMMAAPAGAAGAPPADLSVYGGPLPGAVTQHLLKRYDKNGDYHLTREEVGFDPAEFAKLDADRNGKLSAREVEAWRTGPPDFTAELNLARTAKECSATVTPVGRQTLPAGVELRAGDPGRAVLRVGKQFLDLSVTPPPTGARYPNRLAQQFLGTFPNDRDVVTEEMLVGPQFQFLRIVYDAADFDGNGRLTRDEFRKYLDLQQSTIDLALTLTFATRTPSLFQLMDENGDGRLGIRELRTAFDRLILLEPAGGEFVTKAAIQPSAGLRLGQSAFVATDPAFNGNPFVRDRVANTRGPVWFVKMDRNGDGDVSRTEFLGPAEDFAALDANGDGLISTAEAEAFDKKARRPAKK